MLEIWLPEKKLRTKEIDVPGLDRPIALNLVMVPRIVGLDVRQGDTVSVWDREYPLPQEGMTGLLGHVRVFDIKHMVFGDFVYRYRHFAQDYYHVESVTKSPKMFRKYLASLYDGIVDGQIITAVFFTANQDLLDSLMEPDGTAAETTNS